MLSRIPRFTIISLTFLTIIFLVIWILVFADTLSFELGNQVVIFIISLIVWLLFAWLIGFIDKDKQGVKFYKLISFWLVVILLLMVVASMISVVIGSQGGTDTLVPITANTNSNSELISRLQKVYEKNELVNAGNMDITLVDIKKVDSGVASKQCVFDNEAITRMQIQERENCPYYDYYGLQFKVKNVTHQQQTWNRLSGKVIYKDGEDVYPFISDLLGEFGETYDWDRRDYKLEAGEELTGWQVVRVDRRRPEPIFGYALSGDLPLVKWRFIVE